MSPPQLHSQLSFFVRILRRTFGSADITDHIIDLSGLIPAEEPGDRGNGSKVCKLTELYEICDVMPDPEEGRTQPSNQQRARGQKRGDQLAIG